MIDFSLGLYINGSLDVAIGLIRVSRGAKSVFECSTGMRENGRLAKWLSMVAREGKTVKRTVELRY